MLRFSALFLAFAAAFAEDDIGSQVKRLTEAYAIVEANAADPVASEQAFYQGAIPGMLRKLDPHSIFFDPGQFEQLKKLETSTQKGFGTVVSVLPGRVIVLQTLPGTPSAKAGIAAGDEIVAVNGYALNRLDMEQIVGLLGQSRQQQAQLVVRRPGNARMLDLVLTPEELQSPSVERAFLPRPGVGYVRVASFDEKTGAQIREAIEKLGGAKLKGLVLDLRNNPGGMLTSALEMSSLFLKPGTRVVTVRGRAVKERVEEVPKTATALRIPGGGAGQRQERQRVGDRGGRAAGPRPRGDHRGAQLRQGAGGERLPALGGDRPGADHGALLHAERPLHPEAARRRAVRAGLRHRAAGRSSIRPTRGRVVTGGGGITPDEVVYPPGMSRLRAVLDATGSFTTFATEYLLAQQDRRPSSRCRPRLLDDFKVFLSERSIQPGVGEWSTERDFIVNRLKTELFNQAFGVEKGDEIEAQRDPQILRALSRLE